MRDRTILSMIFVVLLLSSPLWFGSPASPVLALDNKNTRAAGETLLVDNQTVVIDKTSSQEQKIFDKIIFGNNATLIIRGTIVITDQVICQANYVNTSFSMVNDGALQARLTVQEGFLDIEADHISLVGSVLTVSNSKGTLPSGENGKDSKARLVCRRSDLVINDTLINIQGQNGAVAGTNMNGGNGGDATLELAASGNHEVNITGTSVELLGGKGGDAYSPSWVAGEGGTVQLDISGNRVFVERSEISLSSGNAGSPSVSSIGNTGGNSRFEMKARTSDIIMNHVDVEVKAGASTGGKNPVQSFIKFTTLSGGIEWDKGKSADEVRSSVSRLIADTVQFEARDGSELYQVDVGSNPPTGFSGTSVKIFWWAKVKVRDNTGVPMSQVAIRYFIPPDTTTLYPITGPVFTDDNGETWLQVVAYENDQYVWYTFRAEDQGGASGASDRTRFNSNSNLVVNINLTTIVIDEFSDRIIGGLHRFYGTAESGGSANRVNRVVVYLGAQVLGEANDTAPSGSTPFLTWEFIWNTEQVPDGFYTFSFIAFDNSYQATLSKEKEINQTSVPHPPVLESIIVTDPERVREIHASGNTSVHVNQNDKLVDFKVKIFDVDYRSDMLIKGKKPSSAEARLIYTTNSEVIKTWAFSEFTKVNESGGFEFEFTLDTSKKPGTSKALDDGIYRMEIDVEDDAGKFLKGSFITFDLIFDYYPNAYGFIDMVDGKRLDSDMVPVIDQFVDYEAFILSTEKSHTVTARFNLTRSNDQDSPKFGSGFSYQDLTFKIWYRRIGASGEAVTVVDGEKGIPYVLIEFNVEDVKGKETGDFDLWIETVDQDGLTDTVRYIIRVSHDPPKEEHSVMGDITQIDSMDLLPSGILTIIYIAALVIMIAAYLGMLFLISFRFNKDRKKKIALIERKREEEKKAKKDTAIEDEVAGTYDSKKYLKDTGADKGKEEFARELQKAGEGQAPKQAPPTRPAPAPGQTSLPEGNSGPHAKPAPTPAPRPTSPPAAPPRPQAAGAVKPPQPQPPASPQGAPARPAAVPPAQGAAKPPAPAPPPAPTAPPAPPKVPPTPPVPKPPETGQ